MQAAMMSIALFDQDEMQASYGMQVDRMHIHLMEVVVMPETH